MPASFTSILDVQNLDDIAPPKPLPPGEYEAIIDGLPEHIQQGRNDNYVFLFPCKLLRPLNVDPTELMESLNGRPLSELKFNWRMWDTPDAAYRIRTFLRDHLGITARSAGEAIAATQGKALIVTIGHYTTKDGRVGSQIVSTAHV